VKTQLLLAAAGMGTRLGQGPKALVEVGGVPLIVRTLGRFAEAGLLEGAVVLHPAGCRDAFAAVLGAAFEGIPFTFREGGAERQLSVGRGLGCLAADTEIVAIHDAARPFVPVSSIQESIAAAVSYGAATVAMPVVDTILQGDAAACLVDTPDRRFLWACQTPQTFRVEVIRRAHARAAADDYLGTDDASLVRRLGEPVKLVMGSALNLKVTTPGDLMIVQVLLEKGLV